LVLIPTFAVCLDRRLILSGLAFAPAFVATMLWPAWCFEFMSAAVLVCLMHMGRQWGHGISD